MKGNRIDEAIVHAYWAAEPPPAPIGIVAERAAAFSSPRYFQQVPKRLCVLALVLATSGVALAATPDGKTALSKARSAVTATIERIEREMMSTMLIAPQAVRTETSGINIPRKLGDEQLQSIVKVSSAPLSYRIVYRGGTCTISFLLSARPGTSSSSSLMRPTSEIEMFVVKTHTFLMMGSAERCGNTSSLIKDFREQQ